MGLDLARAQELHVEEQGRAGRDLGRGRGRGMGRGRARDVTISFVGRTGINHLTLTKHLDSLADAPPLPPPPPSSLGMIEGPQSDPEP